VRNVIKKLKEIYKKYYYISPLDLADSAESNRIHLYFVTFFFSLCCAIALVFLLFWYRNSLREHISDFIYYGFCLVNCFCSFIVSAKVKTVPREKAYIYKNIPFWMCFICGLGISIYNFYVFDQPFVAIIAYIIAIGVSASIFSVNPILFLITSAGGISAMAPGIYRVFGALGLAYSISLYIIFYCLALYKRHSEMKYRQMLKKQRNILEAKTFGNFTILYDKKVIKFTRSKSTELIAYLIYKNGSSVQTKELVSVLYGDYADSSRYGASLRLLISDVKHTLSELEIQNFFVAEYNNFRINPEVVQCDYYDFLAGEQKATKAFAGEFMNQYSWAEDTVAFLERKVLA
jgi:hypothetical protein